MENNENQIILDIHYYLKNNSHSMDMSTRNKMDKHIFNILQEISSACEIQIQLETLAYEEGGLKEKIKIYFKKSVSAITPILIANIIVSYLSGDFRLKQLQGDLTQKQIDSFNIDNSLKQAQIENIKTDTELKQAQIENIKTDTELKQAQLKEFDKKLENNITSEKETIEKVYTALNTNTKFNKNLSDYYKTANEYPKIEQIGYKTDYIKNEKIVAKDRFKDFILKNKEVVETEKEVTIAIISPILQNKTRYKWKGIYNNQIIDFTMSDKEFKKGIENQEYNFLNGTAIVCDLTITTKYDNEGLPSSNPTYKVDNVLEAIIVEDNEMITKQTKKGRKKQIDDSENLFKGLM